jgi:hypothetical protein
MIKEIWVYCKLQGVKPDPIALKLRLMFLAGIQFVNFLNFSKILRFYPIILEGTIKMYVNKISKMQHSNKSQASSICTIDNNTAIVLMTKTLMISSLIQKQ